MEEFKQKTDTEILKEKICKVMEEHIAGLQIQHDVAQDFASTELEEFIEAYYHYYNK